MANIRILLRMRRLYAGSAQKSIVLFTSFVGAICGSSSHRIRSSLLSQVVPPGRSECNNVDLSQWSTSLVNVSPIILSSTAASAICTRGGAVDDDPQRRRGRDYYDDGKRLPPRGREDGDRPGGGDARRGNGPSRPQQGDRDGRVRGNNRYDMDTDRSGRNREYRDNDRSNTSREYKDENKRGNYDEWDRGGERNPRNYKSIDSDRSSSTSTAMDDGKKKKWFSMKKDKTKKSIDEKQTEFNPQSASTIPPPPPPPPSNDAFSSSVEINPAETERIPINYYL